MRRLRNADRGRVAMTCPLVAEFGSRSVFGRQVLAAKEASVGDYFTAIAKLAVGCIVESIAPKAAASAEEPAAIRPWLPDARERMRDCVAAAPAEPVDWFKPLYEDLLPGAARQALGEFYTPDWLAEVVLDELAWPDGETTRLLDPSCGSGTFLVAAIRRIRSQYGRPETTDQKQAALAQLLQRVVGFDLNPSAVWAARANYLLAVRDWLTPQFVPEMPVFFRDSILVPPEMAGPAAGPFDVVAGNPPWISWDNLTAEQRAASLPIWKHYGLFSLSGNAARHGGAKKDLSMLMTYAVADRYLKDGGSLAFVITQTVFQTRGAGDGFRRFRIGEAGPDLRVLRVHDLVAVRPFADASNWTAVLTLQKGVPTQYPVPYVKWKRTKDGKEPASFEKETAYARPADATRPNSPWIVVPDGFCGDLTAMTRPAEYQAHLGANTGGANGVYWIDVLGEADGLLRIRNRAEKGHSPLAAEETLVEPDLVFPLLRWGGVQRFQASPSGFLLLPQDPQKRRGFDEPWLKERLPNTFAYFDRHRELLERRAAYRRYQDRAPFYSMYNVGAYTVEAVKVVWRRMDRQIRAAVVENAVVPGVGPRPIIPQETCVLVAVDSVEVAHYLCAMLNSATSEFVVQASNVSGGKGFGSPGMLDSLGIRRFDPTNAVHRELATLSRAAHAATAAGCPFDTIQAAIDSAAAAAFISESTNRAE